MADTAQNFVAWLQAIRRPRPGFVAGRPSQLPGVLQSGEIRCVYQPIVHLDTLEIFAHETLVRSTSPHWTNPPALFAEAIRSKCCGALGRVIRELAVEGCPTHPLFLNVHPNEFDESWLVQPDDPIFTHPEAIYLEITESVPLSHFRLCQNVLREIRSKGVMLAVDDLGAGYSNLRYIADLAPEIVKLDRMLVSDIHRDARLRTLVSHIVALSVDLGARVVAEGIEVREEAEVVRELGCHFGQGYYFARPAWPAPTNADIAPSDTFPRRRSRG